MTKKVTACGVTFAHDSHLYRTPRGKVKACDGDLRHKPDKSK